MIKRLLLAAAIFVLPFAALAEEASKPTIEATQLDVSKKIFKIEVTGAELDLIGAAIKAAVNVNTGLHLIPIYNKLLDQTRKQIASENKETK